MKRVKFNFRNVVLIMASVVLFSCSKGDTGDTGPAGPAGMNGIDGIDGVDGLDGVDGVDGQDGADGQDGEDGNANVIASPWINVDFPDTPQSFVSFDVDDPIFNTFNTSTAAIYAYGRFEGGDGTINVNSIPFTQDNKSYYFRMLPNSGKIIFIGNTVDNTSEVFDDLEEVRYVVIPFGTGKNSNQNTISRIKDSGVDMSNYQEVAKYFGWTD